MSTELQTNGHGAVAIIEPDPETAAMRKRIESGMADIERVIAQRDRFHEERDEARAEIERLQISAQRAAEAERMHVQKVVQEAVIAGRTAEAEKRVLHDEIADLRHKLERAGDKIAEQDKQLAGFEAFLDMVLAATTKVRHARTGNEKAAPRSSAA